MHTCAPRERGILGELFVERKDHLRHYKNVVTHIHTRPRVCLTHNVVASAGNTFPSRQLSTASRRVVDDSHGPISPILAAIATRCPNHAKSRDCNLSLEGSPFCVRIPVNLQVYLRDGLVRHPRAFSPRHLVVPPASSDHHVTRQLSARHLARSVSAAFVLS